MSSASEALNSMSDCYRNAGVGNLRVQPTRKLIEWPSIESIQGISSHQKEQLKLATVGRVGLLSGGPGVGKTHTITRLLKTLLAEHPHARIKMMASTGKAAQRMTQMAILAGLRGVGGTTIHTALQPLRNGHDGEGWGFGHNAQMPMYADVIVVDEATMIPSSLMDSFLQGTGIGTLVLFVGDPHQLPPVGKGKPYVDMIHAGLPHGHLTELHRFAGRIALVCKQIISGERWEPSEKIDLDNRDFPENMRHIECNDGNRIEVLKKILLQVEARKVDLWEDCQVLCATNDLRDKLNYSLQQMLNPNGEKIDGCKYRIRDKVICTKNQWIDQDWNTPKKPHENIKHYIANGEVGVITKIDKTFVAVEVDGGGTRKHLRFAKGTWNDLDLAYCITTWKAQGSQYKVVITCAEDTRGADMNCDRSFWTTGISRGSWMSLTLGKRIAIDRQCGRVGLMDRKTLLVEKIKSWSTLSESSEFVENMVAVMSEPKEWEDFSDV